MQAYSDVEEIGSEFLSGAEAGTVALTAGDWDAALTFLTRAQRGVEDIESRALVGKERFTEGLASWAINDTAMAYQGEGFERVYLHCCLAMAYLAQGLVDDVYVEARLSNQLLEAEEELYDKEYRAGGLGHLISALAYELIGQKDQAYIDYERMVDKGVGTELAGRALVRLANELGRAQEARRWEAEYGPDASRPPGAANIVVVAGVGLGPFKIANTLAIPTGEGLITVSVPSYQLRGQPVSSLRLVTGTGESVRTAEIENVSQVAIENLEDRLAWLALKSTARGVIKREVTQQLEERWGWEGAVVGNLFSLVSERADLRCWMTLPDSWQASRLFVPPGVHTLRLEAIGGASRRLGTFELEPGETMIVLARSLGPDLYAHPIGGRVIAPSGTTNAGEASTATL